MIAHTIHRSKRPGLANLFMRRALSKLLVVPGVVWVGAERFVGTVNREVGAVNYR